MSIYLLIICVIMIVIATVLWLLLVRQGKKLQLLQTQLQSHELQLNAQQSTFEQFSAQQVSLSQSLEQAMTEFSLVSKQLEHRLKTQQQQLSQFEEKLTTLANQQPEDKLYSRALKMVALGADVEEIVRDCEMPRAEAEMLLSVHRRK